MGLHIFDLDGTLVRKNATFHFYFYLLRQKKLSLQTLLTILPLYARYRAGLPLADLHREVFEKVLLGKPFSLFEDAVEPFLDGFLKSQLRKEVLSDCKGGMRWLFSSSPEFLVGPIAKRLGFEYWVGTQYSLDRERNFSGISFLIDGPQKLLLAQKSPFQREQIIAYSDSKEDLPLLEWAGKAQIINPDRHLLRFAKKRGWEIMKVS